MFEAMESRAMMAAPAISAFTFATGGNVINNGFPATRTAANGLTFNVTATPDTVSNKVTKVQIIADNDNSGTISAGDVLLGNAKKTATANLFSLTLKGKKAQIIPATLAGTTVNFLAIATAKDKTTASDASKSLVINGNVAPTGGTIAVTGPTKNSGVAANSEVNFKLKGFKDSDGKIASYTLIWDADNSGTFNAAKDFVFGSTAKTIFKSILPTNNGKSGGDLINLPSNFVSFIVIATDNNGDTVSQLSTTVLVKTGPTVSTAVSEIFNNGSAFTNTLGVTNIAKGTAPGSASLKKVSFFTDLNNSGFIDKGDKLLKSLKITDSTTFANITVKNSKVVGNFSERNVLAVVEDALGFTSNVAVTLSPVLNQSILD
jgi:hypothetical protein